MANTKSQSAVSGSETKERYTLGYSSQTVQQLQKRTAAREAGFLLPHLSAGMRLLDCGCGPGSISIGLAEAVAPGQVVGVDIEPSQYRSVWSQAIESRETTLRFAIADVYRLPFAANAFDAAFLHNVLSHLRRPLEVLKGIYRLLSPGGVIGISHPDFSGQLISPSDPLLDRGHELYWRLVEHKAGTPPSVNTSARCCTKPDLFALKRSQSIQPLARKTVCERALNTEDACLADRISRSR